MREITRSVFHHAEIKAPSNDIKIKNRLMTKLLCLFLPHKTFLKSLGLLMLTLITSGCINTGAFRSDYSGICSYQGENSCATSGMTKSASTSANSNETYQLHFVEFDDQGAVYSSANKKTVMNQLRSLTNSNQPTLLVTYIHGWNHNADGDDEDGDIIKLRQVLSRLAKENPGQQVVGVYLGWHGRRFPWYLNHLLTFWDRKQTAHQVGRNGMITTLLELEDIVKHQSPNNTMVTIGHSFGGAALFSSIQSILAERYIQSRPFNTTKAVAGFGDLVVLINPAFEAMLYHSLYDLAQDECRAYPANQPPRLMLLSAAEDWAVRWTFPVGRIPNVLFETHEKTTAKYCRPFNSKVTNNQANHHLVKEWRADMTGIGHYDAYVTHFLNRTENCKSVDSMNAITQKESTQVGPCLELTSKNRVQLNNPYMNIFTEDGIMEGHNDIWQPELMEFIFRTIDSRAKATVK